MIELRENDYLTECITTNPNKYRLYLTLRVDSDSAGWPTAIVTPIEDHDSNDNFGKKYSIEEASIDHTIQIVQARKETIPEGDKWSWDNDSTILLKVRPGDFIYKRTTEKIDEHMTQFTRERYICLKILRQISKNPTLIITRCGFSPANYETAWDLDKLEGKYNLKIVEATREMVSKEIPAGIYRSTALAWIWRWDEDFAAFPDQVETYRKENGLTYYTVETHDQLFQEYLKTLETEESK